MLNWRNRGFTLIELLIVIGIVAILATITLLVLNPAETLKKSRDTRRISEVGSIHAALSLVQTQNSSIFLGLPQTVYVSLPDTNLNCSSHALPALPVGWNYACKGESDYRKSNGSGWIPVDFESLPLKTLSSLPVDPVNTNLNGAGLYYAYFAGSWEITAKLESTTYNAGGNSDLVSRDGGKTDLLYEVGTELFLSPAEIYDRSLVGAGAPADLIVPTVSITAPTGGSVSGTINISATASDNVGVAGVQFRIDGVNLGSEDITTSSFSASWDTTLFSNSNHTITAVARDTSSNLATSVGISVTVNNVTADITPPTFSGVNASSIGQTGATITWTTNEAGDSQVYYGTTVGYGSQTSLDSSMVTSHSQILSGLTANTTYHYQVRSEDGSGNQGMSGDFTFMTQASGAGTCEATGGANCFYIASNGNDSNAGTFAAPFKTFAPALNAATPGDFIYARGGTYNYDNSMTTSGGRTFIALRGANVDNGTNTARITISNYPGETPYLDFSDARFNNAYFAILIWEKSFWTIQGLDIKGGMVAFHSEMDGNEGGDGALTHDIIIKNNNIHDRSVPANYNLGLIRIGRGDANGVWNIFIQNNQLHDYYLQGQTGVWNLSSHTSIAALSLMACEQYVGINCGHTGYIEFSGNTVYNMPEGIFIKNPTTGITLIKDNIFYNINALSYNTKSNTEWTHNLIYNLGLQSEGVENTLWQLGHDGDAFPLASPLWAWEGENTTFTYNTVIGLTGLLAISKGSGNVHHNVFFGLSGGGGRPAYISKINQYPDGSTEATSMLQNFESDYNCFITPTANFNMGFRHTSAGYTSYNPTQARSTFGWDPNSVFITQSNPASIFINPASNNYNLINPATCPGMGYYAY